MSWCSHGPPGLQGCPSREGGESHTGHGSQLRAWDRWDWAAVILHEVGMQGLSLGGSATPTRNIFGSFVCDFSACREREEAFWKSEPRACAVTEMGIMDCITFGLLHLASQISNATAYLMRSILIQGLIRSL